MLFIIRVIGVIRGAHFGLGWPRDRVLLIDDDLGRSGQSVEGRPGFQRLLAEVALDNEFRPKGLARRGPRKKKRKKCRLPVDKPLRRASIPIWTESWPTGGMRLMRTCSAAPATPTRQRW